MDGINQAVEDLRLGQYVRAAMVYVEEGNDPGGYLTETCQECKSILCEFSLRLKGYVLIGCEGYWHINRELLGLPKGQWSDWTKGE